MITSTQIDKSIDIWKELIRTLYSVVSELNKIDPDKYHNLKGELWFAARPNDGEIKIVSFDTLYLDSNATNINPKVMDIPIKFLMLPINKVKEIAKKEKIAYEIEKRRTNIFSLQNKIKELKRELRELEN